MESFGVLAGKYDIYNSADYDKYAAFVRDAFESNDIEIKEVLDLGCGTGEMSVRLSDMGYSVTALDNSPEMLSKLIEKINGRDILPVCQDMRDIDLFGTITGCISTFDCLNYLQTTADINQTFSKVGLFMEKGGLLVFDVNTDYAYEHVYADNCYVYESGKSMLVWRNFYNKKTKKCAFYLTSFDYVKGKYIRTDATHIQKNHSPLVIEKAAKNAGFDIIGIYGGLDKTPLNSENPKAYYVLRKNRQL